MDFVAVLFVIGVYVGIPLAVVVAAVLCYIYAVGTRRTYFCPQCGEQVRTEHMHAARCNTCGAPLHETTDAR